MKKFIALLIIALLIIALIVFGCTTCGIDEDHKFVKIDEYNFQGFVIHLAYDPETKVEYFIRGELMCPRYDENGNISFYRGE